MVTLVYYKEKLKLLLKKKYFNYISNKIFFWLSNRVLYFIIFFTKNLNFIKYNYKIYN